VSTPATSFNEREFVTCQISRLVEDKYIYWVGGGGEPLSSVLLAKRMSAPNLQYLTEDGVVGPEAQVPFDPLMTMISSRANYRALQWYAFWLNETFGLKLSGIGEEGGPANGCYDGNTSKVLKLCSPLPGDTASAVAR